MDLYLVSLATGATGLAAMAIGGLTHGAHGGHSAHAGNAMHGGHAGHGGQGGHGAHGGHGGHGGHAGHDLHAGHGAHSHHAGSHASTTNRWQLLLSPRVLFALLVGLGAGGVVANPLSEPWRLAVALTAAVGFESLVVGPLWRLLFRFESQPALTLESAVEDDAQAVTGFDASGCGLVAVEVDGQIVQLLATLSVDDRARGTRVRSGDILRVTDIDPARGRCTVRMTNR